MTGDFPALIWMTEIASVPEFSYIDTALRSAELAGFMRA